MMISLAGGVAPFGDPGINDRSHLPRAFRSVPRPSSPLSAKASTRCPSFALERHTQRQEPYPVQQRCAEATGETEGFAESPGETAFHQKATCSQGATKLSFSEDTSCGIARTALGAARGLPPRSHNSLLHN